MFGKNNYFQKAIRRVADFREMTVKTDKYFTLMNKELDGDISDSELAELEAYLVNHPERDIEKQNLNAIVATFDKLPLISVPSEFNVAVMSALHTAKLTQKIPFKSKTLVRWLGVAAAIATLLPTVGAVFAFGFMSPARLSSLFISALKVNSTLSLDSVVIIKSLIANVNAIANYGITEAVGLLGDALILNTAVVFTIAVAIGLYFILNHSRSAVGVSGK